MSQVSRLHLSAMPGSKRLFLVSAVPVTGTRRFCCLDHRSYTAPLSSFLPALPCSCPQQGEEASRCSNKLALPSRGSSLVVLHVPSKQMCHNIAKDTRGAGPPMARCCIKRWFGLTGVPVPAFTRLPARTASPGCSCTYFRCRLSQW